MLTESVYLIAEQLLAQTGWQQALVELHHRFPILSEEAIEQVAASVYGLRLSTRLSAAEVEKIRRFRNHFPGMTAADLRCALEANGYLKPAIDVVIQAVFGKPA